MGAQQTKMEPTANVQEAPSQGTSFNEQNHFFVEQLTKMSLKNMKQISYYWVDPRVYNAQNQKYYNQFLQHFKIDSFTSIEGLRYELDQIQNDELIKVITAASLPDDDYRYLQNQKKVAQFFLFCGNEERAKLLKSNFPKIQGFGLKATQVITVLKEAEKHDNIDIPPATLLCMLEQDRKLLNKYRLNYYCMTSNLQKGKAKEDFVRLAKSLCPNQHQKITQFETQYNLQGTQAQLFIQTLQWAFEDNFYFRLVQNLPKATTDPKKLAYLRLPFENLWQAVYKRHKELKQPEELYIVTKLNNKQIEKIQQDQTLGNFIIFTSFVKGYLKKADAIKEFKELESSFLFEVTFTKRPREKELDFGFVISENKSIKKNVIFNIYNFFQMERLDVEKRMGTLVYGSLAESFKNRADCANQASKKRITENESVLLRNFDYLQSITQKDKSQAVILQTCGYFKESLEVYERKVEYLLKTNASQAELNKYLILRGDAFRMNQDFEEAEKQYKSIKDQSFKLVAWVHLLELYLKKGDDKNAQVIQEMLQLPSNLRKLKEKFIQEYFKAQNFLGLGLMRQGKYKEALKKFKNLQGESSLHFNYRFEGIPIVHDIFRNMATCQVKLNNHKEALNLLSSTKEWQLVCEGESAGLVLTETMLQHVHNEMGSKELVKTSEQSLALLKQNIDLSERRYLNQSSVAVSMDLNIAQSIVNVNLNPPNINQSIVGVSLEPLQVVNINNSVVGINL